MNLKKELSLLVDPQKNLLAGYLGMTPSKVEVPNRDGYVWVRLLDNMNEVVQAYNSKVTAIYNVPVLISFDGKKYLVEGLNSDKYQGGGGNNFLLPKHGEQHSKALTGGQSLDVVWVDESQFLPLLVRPVGSTGSKNINVASYVFQNSNDDWFYINATGITLPTPSTGSTVSMIMLSDADAHFYILQGPIFTGSVPNNAAFLPHFPSIPNTNDIPVAAVVTNKDNKPIKWGDILNVRQFFGSRNGSGGSIGTLTGNRVVVTNASGTAITDPELTYDAINNELSLGVLDGGWPINYNSMNIGADSNNANIFLRTFGAGVASFVIGLRANGTHLAPAPVVYNDKLMRILATAYDSNSTAGPSSAEMAMVADGNHDVNSHPTRIDFYTIPSGTITKTLALTIQRDGSLNIPTGSTYNIGGVPHTHPNKYAEDMYAFGFISDYAGNQQTTINFNGTGTFTISPTGTTWDYYRNGTKYTITGSKSVNLAGSLPATTGFYYIYIDSVDGSLTSSLVGWTLEDTKVPCASVAWNNTLSPKFLLADERHTAAYPRRMHWEHHFSDGTEVISSPSINGYVVAPAIPTANDNTFGITQSITADEDLKHIIAPISDPSGSLAVVYPFVYRTASTSWAWNKSPMPYLYTSGSYVDFDNAGTRTVVSEGNFTNTYLMVTNDDGVFGYTFLLSPSQFSSLALAQAEEFSSVAKTSLPILEYVAVFQFTWGTNPSYSTLGKARLAAKPVAISVSASGNVLGGGSVPVHGNTHIDTGSDPIPYAVPTGTAGLMSGADKFKLNSLPTGLFQYTDENAQDAIGLMLDATLQYVDAVPALRRAAITGDVTIPTGSNVASIPTGSITFSKLVNMPSGTIMYRRTSAGAPETQPLSTLFDDLLLEYGTYTPTLFNTTNISASTALVCQYLRIGRVVTVSGGVTIDPTATGQILLGMSIPPGLLSAFTLTNQAGGIFGSNVTAANIGVVAADTSNANRINFAASTPDAANRTYFFTFTYLMV